MWNDLWTRHDLISAVLDAVVDTRLDANCIRVLYLLCTLGRDYEQIGYELGISATKARWCHNQLKRFGHIDRPVKRGMKDDFALPKGKLPKKQKRNESPNIVPIKQGKEPS